MKKLLYIEWSHTYYLASPLRKISYNKWWIYLLLLFLRGFKVFNQERLKWLSVIADVWLSENVSSFLVLFTKMFPSPRSWIFEALGRRTMVRVHRAGALWSPWTSKNTWLVTVTGPFDRCLIVTSEGQGPRYCPLKKKIVLTTSVFIPKYGYWTPRRPVTPVCPF